MEATKEYVLDQLVWIYQLDPKGLMNYQRKIRADQFSDKIIWTVSLMLEVTFHEAQSFIFNTVTDEVNTLREKISKVDTVDNAHLYKIVLSTLSWISESAFRSYLWPIFQPDTTIPKTLSDGPNGETNGEKAERLILKLFEAAKGNPKIFALKIKLERQKFKDQYGNYPELLITYETIFFWMIKSNFDPVNIVCCAFTLLKMKVVNEEKLPQHLRTFYRRFISKRFVKFTWAFNKEDWLIVLKHIGSEEILLKCGFEDISSIDYVDALLETFGSGILFKHVDNTSYANVLLGSYDVELIYYLLLHPLVEPVQKYLIPLLTTKIDKILLHWSSILGVLIIRPDISDYKKIKWNYHEEALEDRLQKFKHFIQRLPMLLYRIEHTRKEGGVSVLEESGLREFLDYKSYSPNFEVEKEIMKKRKSNLENFIPDPLLDEEEKFEEEEDEEEEDEGEGEEEEEEEEEFEEDGDDGNEGFYALYPELRNFSFD
jgi:hypothetical protein